MQAAITLKKLGCSPLLIEKSVELGGKLNHWDRLFPSGMKAKELIQNMVDEIASLNIKIMLCSEISEIRHEGERVEVGLTDGNAFEGEALVIATGFELFNASVKEEYGYGIYENVITSADLEAMFSEGTVSTSTGLPPRSVAFLHCVGSRDLQIGQPHCSKVCCMTGVKQAIEIRELLPECQIYNFYMDMRMFGSGYEELYKKAQETFRINFIRGRISEASETADRQIRIKAEDTLLGRPLKLTVDLLVLMIGKRAAVCNKTFADNLDIPLNESGFLQAKDDFYNNTATRHDNVFIIGTSLAPKTVGEALNDASMASTRIYDYLTRNERQL